MKSTAEFSRKPNSFRQSYRSPACAVHRQLTGLSLVKRGVIEALIESTDREIDAQVYRLYGLSEDEIRIVEGG